MVITIDQTSEEPLYLQIRGQIIAGIARGELVAGQALPSVRALASDLGINLHTVNKAYAVLRDEGYVLMRGRAGACIADRSAGDDVTRPDAETERMERELFELAIAYRARGGSLESFLTYAQAQSAYAYGVVSLDADESVDGAGACGGEGADCGDDASGGADAHEERGASVSCDRGDASEARDAADAAGERASGGAR